MYNYSDLNTNSFDTTAIMSIIGALGSLIILFLIIILALVAFGIIVRWKVFKKAGKEGWEAIIPYYNSWVFYEISGYPGWLGLLSLASFLVAWIPFGTTLLTIGLYALQIIAGLSLAKKFHKSEGFGVLIGLLPLIGLAIIAFGNDEYDSSLGNQLNKPASNKNKVYCSNCGKQVPSDTKFCPNCGKEI